MKIIIPAYEPDHKLLSLIKDIKNHVSYEIVLVNDGSSKHCSSIFQNALDAGCTVLHHAHNEGKGAALKTAFSYAIEHHEKEGVICADCDGQHTWQDIKKIADAIPFHDSSIILGCREFEGNVPLKSLIGNKLTRVIFTGLIGSKVTDTQTGLRGFSANMLQWLIHVKGSRFEYEMNQLLQAKAAGYHFFSIPIQTIYDNRNKGTHFQPILDSIRIYLPIIKFSLSSFASGILDFILVLVFQSITNQLLLSVIGARVLSSLCNYFLNKKIVFQAKGKAIAFLKYCVLAGIILFCNYIFIYFFIHSINLSLVFAKIITEVILFLLSFTIQQKLIFHKRQI